MESLADRRRAKKSVVNEDSVNQLGSDLDKLKANAETILDKKPKLEEIKEDYAHEEEAPQTKNV